MKLSEILSCINAKEECGFNADTEIKGICTDSRKIKKGDLFIAYKGKNFDSFSRVPEAVSGGAAAVICERKPDCKIPYAVVPDGRACIAPAARAFYGYADKKLKLIGVTGTNGKTTTTYMLAEIFKAAGKSVGIIGTLGISYGDKFISPELTTPDPVYMHSVFADMAACGVEYVFMEVSAHALYYNKIDGLAFEAGIFTNCTQDHLDFFGDMAHYAECKKLLFANRRCRYCIINSDDKLGVEMLKTVVSPISYGLENPADVFAVDISESMSGTTFVLNLFDELYEIKLSLPAVYNVYNAMAAAACAKILGVKTAHIAKGLKQLKKVNGRLEHVAHFNGADIFVDFAHTPDGLEQSLKTLKKLCKGKLYCLFGCGGNRDRTKRPIMGAVAAENSDFCIITSDNPRFEEPYDIISEIEEGVKPYKKSYVTVTERDVATEYAIRLLEKGDILLVAGKGGEHYQEIMGIKHSYDDNIVIKKIIGD